MNEKLEIGDIVKVGKRIGVIVCDVVDGAEETRVVIDGSDDEKVIRLIDIKRTGKEYDHMVGKPDMCSNRKEVCAYLGGFACLKCTNLRSERKALEGKEFGCKTYVVPTRLHPECHKEIQSR